MDPSTHGFQPAGDAEACCTPLSDFALIGDCHGAALVDCHGAVDWCCLERFDADPIFCRLVGGERGGCFEIRPAGEYQSQRRYLPQTNILETTFRAGTGQVTLTDFMPVGRRAEAAANDTVSLNAPHWLVRVLSCSEGPLTVTVRYSPCGPGFAAHPLLLHSCATGVATTNGPQLYSEVEFAIVAGVAEARIVLQAGQRFSFVVTPGPVAHGRPNEHTDALLAVSRAFWSEWLAGCNYLGDYRAAVTRSALLLKLLTYAPSGAIVAAPTTSLPEQIGGERNWDYRYCWLRDATFTLYALAALGYESEASRFNGFLSWCLRETAPDVRIMYGIECETELAEQTLDHLPGYCNSRPVRKGNAAYRQRQLDIYGEVLDWALLYQTLGGAISVEERVLLTQIANRVADTWQLPGQGIWEMRSEPRQHVYSKIMCWVALDRALRLFGHNTHWVEAREALYKAILEHGVQPQHRYLRQAFDHDAVDAALLLTPIVGFPLPAEILANTVDRVLSNLSVKGYIYRYLPTGRDGLRGTEGAFLVCSFWMVDALLFLDRRDEAIDIFERLLAKANDVGLLPEEIEPNDGKLLGNFPQALTHLALIRSAFILELHEKGGRESLLGAHADRAQQHASVSKQPEALWVAFEGQPPQSSDSWSDASLLKRFW